MKNLYNQDGSLCLEARDLILPKPDNVSLSVWKRKTKTFKDSLSIEELKTFNKLRSREVNKKWYNNNSEKAKEINAKWRAKNLKKVREDHAKWRAENPEKVKENNAKWKAENPTYKTRYMKDYHKQRRAKDPLYHLHYNMRLMGNRVVKQLSLGKKPACTEKWQGCSAEELKTYLESLFLEGMSWDNYGEWHVDHIRPVSSFKPEEWQLINHYTNLQPLWAEDNIKKGNKY